MASVLLDQAKAPTYKTGSATCSGMLFDAKPCANRRSSVVRVKADRVWTMFALWLSALPCADLWRHCIRL